MQNESIANVCVIKRLFKKKTKLGREDEFQIKLIPIEHRALQTELCQAWFQEIYKEHAENKVSKKLLIKINGLANELWYNDLLKEGEALYFPDIKLTFSYGAKNYAN